MDKDGSGRKIAGRQVFLGCRAHRSRRISKGIKSIKAGGNAFPSEHVPGPP
jgi:hypothetical protein